MYLFWFQYKKTFFKGNIKNQQTFPLYTPLKTNMEPKNWFLFGGIFKFHVSFFFGYIVGYTLHKLVAISLQGWIDEMQRGLDASAYDDNGGGATERSCLVRSTKSPRNFQAWSMREGIFESLKHRKRVRTNPVSTTNPDSTTLTQRMMRVFFFGASFLFGLFPLQKWTQIGFGRVISHLLREVTFRLSMFVRFQDQWPHFKRRAKRQGIFNFPWEKCFLKPSFFWDFWGQSTTNQIDVAFFSWRSFGWTFFWGASASRKNSTTTELETKFLFFQTKTGQDWGLQTKFDQFLCGFLNRTFGGLNHWNGEVLVPQMRFGETPAGHFIAKKGTQDTFLGDVDVKVMVRLRWW